jgi:hypothetical protein
MLKKKIWANFRRIAEVFTQKIFNMLSNIWVWDPGSEIRDPEITYPGSRIQGSGSATLIVNPEREGKYQFGSANDKYTLEAPLSCGEESIPIPGGICCIGSGKGAGAGAMSGGGWRRLAGATPLMLRIQSGIVSSSNIPPSSSSTMST